MIENVAVQYLNDYKLAKLATSTLSTSVTRNFKQGTMKEKHSIFAVSAGYGYGNGINTNDSEFNCNGVPMDATNWDKQNIAEEYEKIPYVVQKNNWLLPTCWRFVQCL